MGVFLTVLLRVARVVEFLFFVALLVLVCTGFFKPFPWWEWAKWIAYLIMAAYGIGLVAYVAGKRTK